MRDPARQTGPAPTATVLAIVHTIRGNGGAWAGACDVGPKPGESQTASLALRCLAGDGLALEVDRAETGYRWGTGWTSCRLWSIATLSVFYVKTLL